MPISLIRLLAFDGPNRYGPQPGVLIELSCDHDYSRALRQHLKDAAQRVGVVLAYLETIARPQNDPSGHYWIELRFTTPTPALGAAIGQYVIAAFHANEQGDEQWDAEEPLWLLQKRRRAEALPVHALRILADAARHTIPAFHQANGTIQIGYGTHGLAIAYGPSLHPDEVGIRGAAPREQRMPEIPWAQLGPIPLFTFSGHPHASAVAATAFQGILHRSNSHGVPFQPATLMLDAGFDRVREALAEPALERLIVALAASDMATRGLPFAVCTACAIIGLPDLPGWDALAEIVGLPLLVTDPSGIVALDADTPAIAELSDHAACQIVFFSQSAARLAAQRAIGARVVFAQADQIIGAQGTSEQLLAILQLDLEVSGQLAAWAIWWGMICSPG
jgi:hypothetical protein